MSFIVIMVVGYFDPGEMMDDYLSAPRRPVPAEEVEQLDALCRSILGDAHRFALADCHKNDVLEIRGGAVSYWMYGVACIAHEVFGMSAVDVGHRGMIYPKDDYDLQEWRKGQTLNEEQDAFYQLLLRREEACRQLRDRVRAWVAEAREEARPA